MAMILGNEPSAYIRGLFELQRDVGLRTRAKGKSGMLCGMGDLKE